MGELSWVDGPILVDDNFVEDVVHEITPIEFDPDDTVLDEPLDDPKDRDWEPESIEIAQPHTFPDEGPALRTRSKFIIRTIYSHLILQTDRGSHYSTPSQTYRRRNSKGLDQLKEDSTVAPDPPPFPATWC
ncbi:hypothetical protein J6590_058410 [Homalodisca vitripennis]|nr:hypothetical protein J6590_058410 [Homalodisca vitripennis]